MFISLPDPLCAVSVTGSSSSLPLPSVLLTLGRSLAVPEHACARSSRPRPAGLCSFAAEQWKVKSSTRALAPTPCLIEGRVQPQSTAQFSSAPNKAGHCVQMDPEAAQLSRAEELHLQVDL